MKFSTRLYAAFAGCAAITLILGAFALAQIVRLADHTHEIATSWMPSVQELLSIKSEMREFRTQELQHIISTEAAEMAEWESRMAKSVERLDVHFVAYAKVIVLPEEREAFELLRTQQQARIDGHMKLRALSRENKTAEATALARGEIARLRNATAATVDKLVDLNVRGARQEVAASEASAATAKALIPSLIVLALLLSGAVAWFIVRTTMRQLGGDPALTKDAVDRIAGGDLVTPVPSAAGDTTSLLASLAKMRQNLSGIVAAVVAGSNEIKVASQEVARGNVDLSARTEQQSSSLQETASAMEQLTGTVRQTADNARSANQLARAASETATDGGRTVDQVVATMQTISDSSRKVQEIITVIDGIAFQTNILALNAAVEAARAGEQGRGFAVVAGEVRTLAQRSAEAAREIKRLIEDSVSKVDDGSRLVVEAGGRMQEVVGSVRRVTDIIAEISAATDQQSSGIEQVNQAVGQLDTVTQQNAALVEEAAAATQSMEGQAARLALAIAAFRVESQPAPR